MWLLIVKLDMILKKIEKKISVFKFPSDSDTQELWVKLPFF